MCGVKYIPGSKKKWFYYPKISPLKPILSSQPQELLENSHLFSVPLTGLFMKPRNVQDVLLTLERRGFIFPIFAQEQKPYKNYNKIQFIQYVLIISFTVGNIS